MDLRRIFPILFLLLLLAVSGRSYGLTLYFTEFEEFNAGNDQWAGTNGWVGTSTGLGVHGIDQDILPGLEKTAFIGFNQPASTFVTVFRGLSYDPVSNATPTVEFETLMGIEDSTNGFKDSFFFSFYNTGGNFLASLRFDNTDLNYGIWRLDGVTQTDTGIEFLRSQLHLLIATINFSNNTWSADLDSIPLFTNAQFNATGESLDLGFVAVEWQLTSSSTNEHGDNWMLVADLAVRAFPDGSVPFPAGNPSMGQAGMPSLSWTGFAGFDYSVEYTDDMLTWSNDLAGSTFTNILTETPLSFTDSSNASHRSYRLNRTLAP